MVLEPLTADPPRVELLVIEDCPNAAPTTALVQCVAHELGLHIDVVTVLVLDATAATQYRFLGSPTVRVDDHDVEPGADARTDYALSCRVYGSSGQPAAEWIRGALRHRTAID